jgi:hypothetical protein
MHVHIVTLGRETKHVSEVLNEDKGVDNVYILSTDRYLFKAEEVKTNLENMNFKVFIIKIDKEDFMGIVQTIFGIKKQYDDDCKFSMNITGGTKLMSAAAYYSSYYIRAKPYYAQYEEDDDGNPMLENCKVIEIKSPKAIDISNYSEKKRKVLKYIYDWHHGECGEHSPKEKLTNVMVANRFETTPQNIRTYLRGFKEDELIEIERDGLCNNITLTDHGNMVAKYAMSDELKSKE